MKRSALALALVVAAPALAQEKPKEPTETRVETGRTIKVGDAAVVYTAVAATLVLKDDDGKAKASVFTVSYLKQTDDVSRRPVTFCFNGGPGSSSVWLHLGALGPRKVVFGDEGETPPPPGRLEDNAHSWLDLTDLVFIDPVSTGYSRAAEGQDPKQFHGVEEDVRWMGELIRLWVTRSGRWSSPKFLAGESYGTTRAAALANHLQSVHGMNLTGVVLVSAVLDFQTIRFDEGNDLPYVLFLPSYAAAAFFHRKLEPVLQQDLERTLKEVEVFAEGTYRSALAAGDALPPTERGAVAQALARYTGLSVDFVQRARLRVGMGQFAKELLRAEGKTIGRFDARYTGVDPDDVGATPGYDPSYSAVQGPFTAAVNDYVRRELRFEEDRVYEVLTGRVHPWSWRPGTNRYVNVASDLRDAMARNPYLHVLFCGGVYDLATPYHAMDFTIAHLGLGPEARARVQRATYAAGHMMYVRKADLQKLKADAARFYAAALARK